MTRYALVLAMMVLVAVAAPASAEMVELDDAALASITGRFAPTETEVDWNFDWVDEFASTDQWLAEQVNFDLSNQAMDGMAVVLPAVDMSIDSIHTVSSWGETLIEGFSLHVDAGTRILIF